MDYNRIYRLTITPIDIEGNKIGNPIAIITNPITIKFNVNRMPFAGSTNASIDIYNLNPTTRDALFLDYFDMYNIRMVTLEAGYAGDKFALIYRGRIDICTMKKSGVDVIVHIASTAGIAMFDPNLNITMKAGTTSQELIDAVINQIPFVERGVIKVDDYTFQKDVSVVGSGMNILKEYTKDMVFVDLGILNIFDPEEVIKGEITVLDDETGLLGVPERERTSVTINCMFEPRIKVGQGIEINSRIANQFNGQYKVWGVSHSGTIGDTQGGQCTTTIKLWTGLNIYGRYKSNWELVKQANPDIPTVG